MTTKRIGTNFTDAAHNAIAHRMHDGGMNLQSAFRAVNFARKDNGAGMVNAWMLRRNNGIHP